ncbi:hypothetical protein DFJ73DRAFT_959325 [Zopfochytrium polystomum]|nr:hypothetical protein DFJ73DRAFT_959325 [Zopfochytrium polystomum]
MTTQPPPSHPRRPRPSRHPHPFQLFHSPTVASTTAALDKRPATRPLLAPTVTAKAATSAPGLPLPQQQQQLEHPPQNGDKKKRWRRREPTKRTPRAHTDADRRRRLPHYLKCDSAAPATGFGAALGLWGGGAEAGGAGGGTAEGAKATTTTAAAAAGAPEVGRSRHTGRAWQWRWWGHGVVDGHRGAGGAVQDSGGGHAVPAAALSAHDAATLRDKDHGGAGSGADRRPAKTDAVEPDARGCLSVILEPLLAGRSGSAQSRRRQRAARRRRESRETKAGVLAVGEGTAQEPALEAEVVVGRAEGLVGIGTEAEAPCDAQGDRDVVGSADHVPQADNGGEDTSASPEQGPAAATAQEGVAFAALKAAAEEVSDAERPSQVTLAEGDKDVGRTDGFADSVTAPEALELKAKDDGASSAPVGQPCETGSDATGTGGALKDSADEVAELGRASTGSCETLDSHPEAPLAVELGTTGAWHEAASEACGSAEPAAPAEERTRRKTAVSESERVREAEEPEAAASSAASTAAECTAGPAMNRSTSDTSASAVPPVEHQRRITFGDANVRQYEPTDVPTAVVATDTETHTADDFQRQRRKERRRREKRLLSIRRRQQQQYTSPPLHNPQGLRTLFIASATTPHPLASPFAAGTHVALERVDLVQTIAAEAGGSGDSGGGGGSAAEATLVLTLLVRNVAYDKRPVCVYTRDGWQSPPAWASDGGRFVQSVSVSGGGTVGVDRFELCVGPLAVAGAPQGGPGRGAGAPAALRVEFAVGVEMDGQRYWDNREGRNHAVVVEWGGMVREAAVWAGGGHWSGACGWGGEDERAEWDGVGEVGDGEAEGGEDGDDGEYEVGDEGDSGDEDVSDDDDDKDDGDCRNDEEGIRGDDGQATAATRRDGSAKREIVLTEQYLVRLSRLSAAAAERAVLEGSKQAKEAARIAEEVAQACSWA